MNFQQLIQNVINQHESASASQKTIVAFRGISKQQVALLANSPKAFVNNASYLTEDGSLDLLALNAAKQQLLVNALQSEGTSLALFEELLLLAPSLPILNAKVIIVQNNLFFGNHAPCYIQADQADALVKAYSSDLVPEKQTDLQTIANELYANVCYTGNNKLLATYISPMTDADIEIRNLFERTALPQESTRGLQHFELSHKSVEDFAFDMIDGTAQGITINLSTQVQQNVREFAETFAGALNALDVPFGISWNNPYAWEEETASAPDLKSLLKQHWGEDAEFRNLLFYKNPSRGKELMEMSQEVIVNQAVQQAEAALEDKPYRNIFVTAPTGAGKSLLFQLPATYLARKHNALTIVVSPLIALMGDQVKSLAKRGIKEATFLNSNVSHQERERRMQQILDGSISILYISPEAFNTSSYVSEILAQRKLGLMVVDEAHTVTTWGKDFRSDYWLLGDNFRKLKSAGRHFPIMCLTATAVLGGLDDTVNQTLLELGIDNPLIYIGNVKRDNIAFDINVRDKKDFPGSVDEAKVQLAAEKIAEYVHEGHKSLVYCPYASQTGDILEAAQDSSLNIPHRKVWKYTGSMESAQKNIAEENFNREAGAALVCTKAYGMGVDNDEIERVYHYAPTGGLADYVQEIGRAGRKKDAQAVASVDFFANDLRYFRSLAGMNTISAKQLRLVMGKLYELYCNNGKTRNMLVSPQSFSYLFGDQDCEEKFIRAMMILREDFQNKHGYPLLIVQPQATFTKNYVNVPTESEASFLAEYGAFSTLMPQPKPRNVYKGKKSSYTTLSNGKLYCVDMAKLWLEKFPDMTFREFKYKLFNNELFEVEGLPISPRKRLTVKFNDDFEETMNKFEDYLKCIDATLMGFKSAGRAFTKNEFIKVFMGHVDEGFQNKDELGSVLEFFVSGETYRSENSRLKDPVECVYQRRMRGQVESQYVITKQTYVSVTGTLVKGGANCAPNKDERTFEAYLPSSKKGSRAAEMRFASLIQLFGLGTYEIAGGEDPQVFVRINNPLELKHASEDQRYSNAVLKDMRERKDRSAEIMKKFFMMELSDEQRWDVIEDYFLGDMASVNHALQLEGELD